MGETAEFGEASIPINQAVSRWRRWVDRPDLARTKSKLKVDRPDLPKIKRKSRVDRPTSPMRVTRAMTDAFDPVIVAFPARRLSVAPLVRECPCPGRGCGE